MVAAQLGRADAQEILQSGGVQRGTTSVVEIHYGEDEVAGVEQILETTLGRSRVSGYGRTLTGFSSSQTTRSLCSTPCRLRLREPIDLQVNGHYLRLNPDGTDQSWQVTPRRNALHQMAVVSIVLGISAIPLGAATYALSYLPPTPGEQPALTRGQLQNVGIGVAISGAALLTLGFILRRVARARVERIDTIQF